MDQATTDLLDRLAVQAATIKDLEHERDEHHGTAVALERQLAEAQQRIAELEAASLPHNWSEMIDELKQRAKQAEARLAERHNCVGHDEAIAKELAEAQQRLAELEHPLSLNIEVLAAEFHAIYQIEARRQGDVRHRERYADLPENIKEYDRVLARYVLQRISKAEARP